MLEVGSKVFGDWIVDGKIGSGAFGTVYKIKRVEFGNEYYAALKVINIPQDSEEQARLRSEGMDDESITTYYGQIAQDFIQEIKLLSSLDGITNIVDYKDHSVVPNDNMGYTIYIKMQLLTPLNKMLVNEENKAVFLAENEIIDLGIDICSALEICEKHKIIHRDIKVDNIFVSANGDYKLGDFGIAKQLEATQGEMSKKGTMMYMAPEVFKGENYNHTVDIYSLGIVMYRLFNKNRAPFFPQYPNPIKFSDKETANAQRLNGAELPDIPGLSEKLMAVLRKACAFRVEDRYQTAAEFKKCLKEIKKSGAVLNQSTETVEQVLHQEEIINTADEKTQSAFAPVVEENMADDTVSEATVGVFDHTVFSINQPEETKIKVNTENNDVSEFTGSVFKTPFTEIKTKEAITVEETISEDVNLDATVGVFNNTEFSVVQVKETQTKQSVKELDVIEKKDSALNTEKNEVTKEENTQSNNKLSTKTKVVITLGTVMCFASFFMVLLGDKFSPSMPVLCVAVFFASLGAGLTLLIKEKRPLLNKFLPLMVGLSVVFLCFSVYAFFWLGWLPMFYFPITACGLIGLTISLFDIKRGKESLRKSIYWFIICVSMIMYTYIWWFFSDNVAIQNVSIKLPLTLYLYFTFLSNGVSQLVISEKTSKSKTVIAVILAIIALVSTFFDRSFGMFAEWYDIY